MAVKKQEAETPRQLSRREIIMARMKALKLDAKPHMGDDFTATEFIPTGIKEIDAILGDGGGIPRGTLVEFCGENQSGKTHLALCLIAEAQKMGHRAAFFNVENSFYEPRAASLGVQVRNEDLFELYQDMDSAEKYGNWLLDLVAQGEYGVVVVDSITALVPEVDFNKDLADNAKVGAHATFVNRLLKRLMALCSKTNTIVVLINQFRTANIGGNTPVTKTATGGKAMEYFTHMRLWINRINGAEGAVIADGGVVVGGKSNVEVKKTRFGQPGLTTVFKIMFKQAEVNPLGEFLYRAQARGKEFIKVHYKRYQYEYVDRDTGEVKTLEDKDAAKFLEGLLECPPPTKLTRNDGAPANAFEYIAKRLKMNEAQKQDVLNALNGPTNVVAPSDTKKLEDGNLDIAEGESEDEE